MLGFTYTNKTITGELAKRIDERHLPKAGTTDNKEVRMPDKFSVAWVK